MKKLLVLSLTLAGLLFIAPLEAEAKSYTGYGHDGDSRSESCSEAKNEARRGADRYGTVTSVTDCSCRSREGSDGSRYSWSCQADAYYDPD